VVIWLMGPAFCYPIGTVVPIIRFNAQNYRLHMNGHVEHNIVFGFTFEAQLLHDSD
jgi:hypothetical protein